MHAIRNARTTRTTRTVLIRRAALTAAAVTAAALTLSACGSDGGKTDDAAPSGKPSATAGASAGTHNAADVTFAREMIPHHRQAVAMADLAATRAGSADVKALAATIKKAQDPEITTMSGWLKSWGEKVPQDQDMAGMHGGTHGMEGTDGMAGMDHGGAKAMPGMMSAQEMATMKNATGKAFDAQFLKLMVKHHQGAVEMAGTERKQGAYGPAKKLAGDIITAQNAEIARMRKLLG
ncbi:DUF305 domain-containing protein [Streptomyces sp. NRRL S-1448]|uniref:DUF305 domain-containing protein n=1 Tax=Streptomyces sp. NRRL S-1448 TaxID=1463883 RepID=UPI00068CE79C|nr:DUF305 domain-containing protein [Streptomyces sp. NRRL S-1448]